MTTLPNAETKPETRSRTPAPGPHEISPAPGRGSDPNPRAAPRGPLGPQPPDPGPRTLSDTTERDLRALPKKTLEALARAEKVSAAGTRREVLDRLVGLRRGGDKKFVPGKTLCPLYRHGPAKVLSTQGAIRYMECTICGYRFQRATKA